MEYTLLQGNKKVFQRKSIITIGDKIEDIVIRNFPFKVWIEGDVTCFEGKKAEGEFIYHNERKYVISPIARMIPFREGDTFYFANGSITVYAEKIEVDIPEETYETELLEQEVDEVPFEGFPHYKRSPRLIKRVPTDQITISKPPQKSRKDKKGFVQLLLPPIIMLGVTITVSILMKRGLFVIISAISTVMSIILSAVKYVKDRKESREHDQKRAEMYDQYLLSVRKQLYEAREKETEAWKYNYPEIKTIENMVNNYNSRIYERSVGDGDFLTVSIGTTTEPVSFQISMPSKELEMEKDELEEEAQIIKNEFSRIENKPVIIDLKKAHLGLVGEKDVIHEQLKLLVAQLTFFHSYHELEIINIFSQKYNDDFKWMNWYPHLQIHSINVYGCVNSERMRDHVLGSMYRIIKDRKLKQEEDRKENRFLPHYIFIIDDPKLITDHAIMEYLDKEGDNLGFSIIYTTHMRANLPENIKTILQLEHSDGGVLLLNNGEVVDKKIKLQRADAVDFEQMARNLSVLIHEKGIISQIPESITFFDMYHVERPEQLQIEERWRKNQSYKSLAVPLGVRGTEDYLYLNLHEKAHGPHGLVAGTTGSGKSEIVQSYILSLAVNFHPHEVGFLLIDYKGGGMAGLFKNLPHLLGTITNLDGSESMRAMASIKSELSRRQKIFGQNNVNHINDYNKLFKLGEVEEPLPHLFLISDEFAELKKEQPEFMSELVSAARIGRSLGIHLILATQKPSGVVDDQIWTNSRFKLALKVQNEADSKEIIKTPDAAFITQPGRAYLQVGNNEIYELFQSAWSGAAFQTEQEEKAADDRVYLVNDLGQGELINNDLSHLMDNERLKVTQLDVTIDYIHDLYQQEEVVPVKKPWLPPLENRMVSPYVENIVVKNCENEDIPLDLDIAVGLIDIPEEQRQTEYHINLLKEGNIAFFAAAGYGKSMFLTTLIISLALKNSVDKLNFYICDFGNSALIPLNRLPHTADYIIMDDSERIKKMMRILSDEMKLRKKLFAQKMVQNFDVYNQMSNEPLKAIVVVIDNYDVVKEIDEELGEFLGRLSRDGVGLGLYTVFTATRQGAVRYAILNNFKTKIAGFLMEKAEAASIVGKSKYQVPEIEGRVLVKHDNVNTMQVYTMVPFKNEIDYNASLKTLLDKFLQMYPTKRAPRIPILPENFVYSMLGQYVLQQTYDILLGLYMETVEVAGFDSMSSPFVILGDAGRGKTNLLKVILEQVAGKETVFLFDSENKELFYHKGAEKLTYIESQEQVEDFMEDFMELTAERKSAFHKALEADSRIMPKNFYTTLEQVYLVIDDTDEFATRFASEGKGLTECLKQAVETGCGIIATMHSTKTKNFDEITKFFKTATEGILVGTPGAVSIFPSVPSRSLPNMGEGLLYHSGNYERVLLPKYEEEDE